MVLFVIIGLAKTRLVAQIAAAIVGTGFIIGIQLVAIASFGTLSRLELLTSSTVLEKLRGLVSVFWLPALGAAGDHSAAISIIGLGILAFLATIALTADRYGEIVLRVPSIDLDPQRRVRSQSDFRDFRPSSVLHHKEWKLLLRNKWLLLQTLMQLLYLIAQVFMLWQGFGQGTSPEFVVVLVVVMAAGQLAGGLA
jgi:ABC-2 type transport system permease protein